MLFIRVGSKKKLPLPRIVPQNISVVHPKRNRNAMEQLIIDMLFALMKTAVKVISRTSLMNLIDEYSDTRTVILWNKIKKTISKAFH